jgi:hypothetical protein
VIPGEHSPGAVIDGFGPAGPIVRPVWHFQDDAVTGRILDIRGTNCSDVQFFQPPTTFQPTNYIDGVDGPGDFIDPLGTIAIPGIQRFSKDLAFELYTVPEPSSFVLMGLGLAGVGFWARRRGR